MKSTKTSTTANGQIKFSGKKTYSLKQIVGMMNIPNKQLVSANAPVNDFFPIETPIVKTVAGDILNLVWKDANEVERLHFQNLLSAMLKSVRGDVMKFLVEQEPRDIEQEAKKKFDILLKTHRDGLFDSQIIETRYFHRMKYYEQCYDCRALIQNFNWCFEGLDSDIMKFIKEREKAKMYSKDFDRANKKLGKGKGQECLICKHNCCTHVNSICLFCEDYDKLLFFIKVSCFFKILGSMFLFYWFLDTCTFEYICANAEKFASIFKNDLSISVIEKYGVYKKIYDELHPPMIEGPDVEESEDEESDDDDPDEEHKILEALQARLEEKKEKQKTKDKIKLQNLISDFKNLLVRRKEKKEKKLEKLYSDKKFMKKFSGLKRRNDERTFIARSRAGTSRESQLENLSMLKDLLEDEKEEKTLMSYGDKSLV